ncbi:MAG: HPr family phosphocarrier protein [Lachnospiraceae bacterium]
MVSQKVVVINESGVHARPAGLIVKTTAKYNSDVTFIVGEKTVVAKSILNIMVAGMKCGTEVEIRCDGENEEAELAELVALFESGLGE